MSDIKSALEAVERTNHDNPPETDSVEVIYIHPSDWQIIRDTLTELAVQEKDNAEALAELMMERDRLLVITRESCIQIGLLGEDEPCPVIAALRVELEQTKRDRDRWIKYVDMVEKSDCPDNWFKSEHCLTNNRRRSCIECRKAWAKEEK